LSIVAQAFALVVFIYLCAGEDLPPSSGDADEVDMILGDKPLISEMVLSQLP
jgi:hypothetical protein